MQPAELWAKQRRRLLLLGGVLAGSIALVALQSMVKQQTLFGNFPMLLRWNFHRLMLGQSMAFYQDEFAGRIATKVMQTALAVRDTWLIVCELLVFVVIYFVTMLAVLGELRRAPAHRRSSAGSCCTSLRCATSCRGWAAWRASRPTRAR